MRESTPTKLETIVINPKTKPLASVIWLHGLGADGNDFAPIVPQLGLPSDLPARFIFPHAPMQPVTINNGYVMRAWYDIVSLEDVRHADPQGIHASVSLVKNLIEHEVEAGIPANKIIVGGFSQGSVIALTIGLTYQTRLAGIIALSGYLPFGDQVMANASQENKSIPIFLAHGTEDTVVPYALGTNTKEILTKNHYSVAWHNYAMPHSVCLQEVRDIGAWLVQILQLS